MIRGRSERGRQDLVFLIWLYFVLLVTEGAMRKWLVPSFSDALLVVRDPIAVVILFLATWQGYLPLNRPVRVFAALFVGFLALAALQTAQQTVPLSVTVFGLRTYFLHTPLIFIMAGVLHARDVRRLLLALIIVAVPVALLMAEQFRAAPTDWINRGAGEKGLQMLTAMGRVRPAGPFSFISGPVFYFGLVVAALIGSHLGGVSLPLLVRICGWGAVLLATAVSGSRALVAGLVPILAAGGVVLVWRPGLIGRGFKTALLLAGVVCCLWSVNVVQEGIAVLDARFEQAGPEEFMARSRHESMGAWSALTGTPLLGFGLGLGTNAGGALAGRRGFQLGEGEWARVISEVGPLMGTAYLAWRIWLVVLIARVGLRAVSSGNALPFLLLGACAVNLVVGQWGQPTTLGFAVFSTGLCLAACRLAVTGVAIARAESPKTVRRYASPLRGGQGRRGVASV